MPGRGGSLAADCCQAWERTLKVLAPGPNPSSGSGRVPVTGERTAGRSSTPRPPKSGKRPPTRQTRSLPNGLRIGPPVQKLRPSEDKARCPSNAPEEGPSLPGDVEAAPTTSRPGENFFFFFFLKIFLAERDP